MIKKESVHCSHYDVVVESVREVAHSVKEFVLKQIDGKEVFDCSAGSHITIDLPLPKKLHKNTYSIIRRTSDKRGYVIAVLKNENGRGGSKWMHENVKVGDAYKISTPGNMFSPKITSQYNILFAGGIGITPMISYIEWYEKYGGSWELHYASRSPDNAAFYKDLKEKYGDRIQTYFESEGQRCDIEKILLNRSKGTNAYICGPAGMIKAMQTIGESMGWPETSLHSELFSAEGGEPFTVHLAKSKKSIHVGETQTMLEAIEDAGVEIPNVCRGGGCGYCKTKVLQGTPEHRDFYLTDHEKDENDYVMPCVSRCEGTEITIKV